jgi:hypothetical protein
VLASAEGNKAGRGGRSDLALCNSPSQPPKLRIAIFFALCKMRRMESFAAIINAWPDPVKFAQDVGVTPSLVAVWKTRDTIPSAYWNWVVGGAERRGIDGVSFELLGRLSQAKRTKAAE